MKISIVLLFALLSSGCTTFFPHWYDSSAGVRKYDSGEWQKEQDALYKKWTPPPGATTYCSPRTEFSSYCVSEVGNISTRCTSYADGSMVCNTERDHPPW